MSRYAQLAQQHWKSHRPADYQALTDPETFFSDLGEQIQAQIQDLQLALEANQRDRLNQAEDLERIGILNAIRSQAEETVLQDLLYGPTPPILDVDQEQTPRTTEILEQAGIDPATSLPNDPQHPVTIAYHSDDPDFPTLHRQWLGSLPDEVITALP